MCQKCTQEVYFEHFEALGQTCAKSDPRRSILSILRPWARHVPKVSPRGLFSSVFEALGQKCTKRSPGRATLKRFVRALEAKVAKTTCFEYFRRQMCQKHCVFDALVAKTPRL